ncbi:MAG: endolytic transglycosylase MltG [Solirubrobacterales bacterium]
MSDESKDWLSGDAFADASDPAAIERERRRKEREERRQAREAKHVEEDAVAPPAEDPPAVPPPPPRSAEAEFWDEPPAEAPPPPPPPGPGNGGGAFAAARRHPLRIVGAIAAIVGLWFLVSLFQPFQGDGSGKVTITVPKGASVAEVGDLLDREGVVSSSTLFQVRVTLAGKRSDLYPGQYVLASGMSYGAAIDALSTAPVKATTTVTIPEGYSREETAGVAEEVGLSGDYMEASVSSRYLDPAKYGGKGAKSLEGFLFPDTFELKAKAPVDDLVQLQLEDFKRRIKGVDMGYARSKNLTVYDVVTIASMVEREAQIDSERPLVAAVIYNRLHEGIPLGIDATIRFATGNYDQPLTESELAVDSPYNTRLNGGLPPGPIGSPGLASLEAAARPAKVDYLYYVVEPGTCGEHSFSTTDAQFQADVARYNEAREAAGGESPDSC